ncbi:polyprenyl synthetase family protein [uncultured bacterium]|nr:polyprenyl synthetase family protein [uncultured bacterium]
MSKDPRLAKFESMYHPKINQYLKDNLKKDVDQKTLNQAMNFSVLAGGKRLRPMLTLATLKTLGAKLTPAKMKATCALELLHTYSLIHDDLPAMDDDGLRRHKPTSHAVFGAGMATLAGDGLLTLAFQWLVDNSLSVDTKVKLVDGLSKAAGPSGMVSGQASDIEFEDHQLPLSRLKVLHRHKTGALIHYAVQAGLIMGHAKKELVKPLLRFADCFGLAFQIYDDILDVVGSEVELGKPVGQDSGKNTYPNLLGLVGAYDQLEAVLDHGRRDLDDLNRKSSIDTGLLKSFFSYFQVKRRNHRR